MAKQKPATTFIADDGDDSGKAALGCLAAVVIITVISLAVAFLVDFDQTGEDGRDAGSSGGLPITKVEALDNKTAVGESQGQVLARNLEPGDQRGVIVGHSGVIVDLMAEFYENGAEPEVIERELNRRSVCYNGRRARLARSILAPDSRGFALTFGARSHDEGEPYPRLEFFHGISDDLDYVYYVSLTRQPVRGFDPMGIRIPNTRRAVGRVMLEWVAEVANTACPPAPS